MAMLTINEVSDLFLKSNEVWLHCICDLVFTSTNEVVFEKLQQIREEFSSCLRDMKDAAASPDEQWRKRQLVRSISDAITQVEELVDQDGFRAFIAEARTLTRTSS
jgi:hypothetical protein